MGHAHLHQAQTHPSKWGWQLPKAAVTGSQSVCHSPHGNGTKHSADGEAAVGEEQGRSWLSQEQSLGALGFCFKEFFPG